MQSLFSVSISRLIIASFVFVLLLPLGFIILYLNQHSWDSAKQELKEKHYLIAKGLEKPIEQYIQSSQRALKLFSDENNLPEKLSTRLSNEEKSALQARLKTLVNSRDNIVAASYLEVESGDAVISVNDKYRLRDSDNLKARDYHQDENRYRKYKIEDTVMPVRMSSISNRPVTVISHHIISPDRNKKGSLFIELELQPISDICKEVAFGKEGYCAVVDQEAQVVAHPDATLESQMKDLSATGILDKLREDKNGIWSFHDPILDKDMTAGYAAIEGTGGWSVIIPQPKSELESPFKSVINTVILWLGIGIIISLLVAFWLARKITKPLNLLVDKSQDIGIRAESFSIGDVPQQAPKEIAQLWSALAALLDRLHDSNKEVRKLNYSLSKDIEKATEKLRANNAHLLKISSMDHLTQIANRRYFEENIKKIFKKKAPEMLGIIAIDVDKFKHINDHFGHEAGDIALKHIANIMKQNTRESDLPARLGGDEFVIYVHNCDDGKLKIMAENIRRKVEENPIEWEAQSIPLSLSMGTVNCSAQEEYTLDQLLKFADEAMYQSKLAGRNNVSSYDFAKGAAAVAETVGIPAEPELATPPQPDTPAPVAPEQNINTAPAENQDTTLDELMAEVTEATLKSNEPAVTPPPPEPEKTGDKTDEKEHPLDIPLMFEETLDNKQN